jgi:hypothetical protein
MDESDFLFFAECKELAQNILSYEDTKADHHLVYAFFHSSIKKNSSIEEKINRLKRIGESSTIFENRVGCYAQLNV